MSDIALLVTSSINSSTYKTFSDVSDMANLRLCIFIVLLALLSIFARCMIAYYAHYHGKYTPSDIANNFCMRPDILSKTMKMHKRKLAMSDTLKMRLLFIDLIEIVGKNAMSDTGLVMHQPIMATIPNVVVFRSVYFYLFGTFMIFVISVIFSVLKQLIPG